MVLFDFQYDLLLTHTQTAVWYHTEILSVTAIIVLLRRQL